MQRTMTRVLVRVFLVGLTAVGLAGCGGKAPEVTGDASLTSLSLSPNTLSPAFDSTVVAYTATAAFSDTTMDVTSQAAEWDQGAVVTVNGVVGTLVGTSTVVTVDLAEGINVIKVRVTTTGGAAKVYTITVTRTSVANFAEQAFAKAANAGAGDEFGAAVALDGNTLVVGSPLEDSSATGANGDGTNNGASDSGAVYVFTRSGATWTQEAYLKPLNTGAGDRFGTSVAISGDTIVVGAPLEDSSETGTAGLGTNNSARDSGAAYVFLRTAGVWNQEAYLKASNTEAGDQFGWSVAVNGNTVAVGAPGEDSAARTINGGSVDESNNDATYAGAVYVFTRSGATWSQESYVKADNTDPGDDFGVSVALSGDTLAVGASGESSDKKVINSVDPDRLTNNLAPVSGAVYVFTRAATVWTQQAYIKAFNTDVSDTFGWQVALDADTLAVSAPLEDSAAHGVNTANAQIDNGSVSAGAVYVFTRSGTTWSQEAYIKASNTGSLDSFGWGLGLSGDYLAVGAPGEDSAGPGENNATVTAEANQSDNTFPVAGAVYVFHRTGSTWTQLDYLKASNAGSGDGFGVSVALNGTTVATGAIWEDSAANVVTPDNAVTNSGAVYVYPAKLCSPTC